MTVNSSQSSLSELEHVLPHNLEAERSVLGCCLMDRAALLTVMARLKPEDFFHPPHKIILEVIKKLFSENINPDYISLTNALIKTNELDMVGGAEYIAGLTTVVPSIRSAEHYASIVSENAQLRRLHRLGSEMSRFVSTRKKGLKEIVGWASDRFLELLNLKEHKSYSRIGSVGTEFMKEYSENYEIKEPPGTPTGYTDLDRLLLGLQPGNLIILAARPSQGKTALALDIARNVASTGKKVAFCSLEMSENELLMRLLCATGKLDSYKLRRKCLSDKEDREGNSDWARLRITLAMLDKMAIYIDDSSALTISELIAKVKAIKLEQEGLDLVVVDYLQLIDGELGSGEMRVQEVSKISRNLKALARDVEAPVLALSQLSRNIERREGHKRVPQLSDLRESGAIEQDADVVLFIHREISDKDPEESYERDADETEYTKIIIAKNRNGKVGSVEMVFVRQYATFEQQYQPKVKTYSNT